MMAFAIATDSMISADAGRGLSIRVLRTWEELREIEQYWRTCAVNPNADYDFFKLIVAVRPEILHPYVIVADRDGRPEYVLVGRKERCRLDVKIGYATLLRPKVTLITFIHGGELGTLNGLAAAEVLRMLVQRLQAGDADAASFTHLRQDSMLSQAMEAMPGFFSCDPFPVRQPHRALELPDEVARFFAGLSPKVRKNQKWQAKKLHQAFPDQVLIRCYRKVSDLDCMFSEVERIAKQTYQRGLGVGFADTAEMRQRMALAASRGWLRAYVLNLGREPAAFWIGTLYRGVFYSDSMGYNTAFGHHSPGTYLLVKVIEEFCAEEPRQVSKIDFGLGDAQYKQVFGTENWSDKSAYVYAPTSRGLALKALRLLAASADRTARSVARKLRLEARIKTGWRNWTRVALTAQSQDGPKGAERVVRSTAQ